MSTNWTKLNAATAEYRSLLTTDDPDDILYGAVFSGLEVKLAEITAQFPFGGGATLLIYADTLVVDTPSFDARGAVIVARTLDVSLLGGSPMPLRVPTDGRGAATQVLIGGTSGGEFRLSTTEAMTHSPPDAGFAVPAGVDPLQSLLYLIATDGSVTPTVRSDRAGIADLTGRPWALNSFKASFEAATILSTSSDPADRDQAGNMLRWVLACIRPVGSADSPHGDFGELYSNAAALLVTLNVAAGAYYVPVLSPEFYRSEIASLLDALQSYENNLNTLDVQTGIDQAIEQVAGTLQQVADDELGPFDVDLQNVRTNLDNLASEVRALQHQYAMQSSSVEVRYALLNNAIVQAQVVKILKATFEIALANVKIGIAVAKIAAEDYAAIGDAASGFIDAAKAAYTILDQTLAKTTAESNLVTQARQLIEMQVQLMRSYQAGTQIWGAMEAQAPSTPLPTELAAISVDPALAWDNYMVAADAEIQSLRDGSDSTGVKAAANSYLAAVKILAQYGKAVDAKVVAYSQQLARASVIASQIKTSKTIEARWRQLAKDSASSKERLAALKGLLLSRANNIKRSVFVSWTHFRNSYFYLYFQQPDAVIQTDMDAAQMKTQVAGMAQWVGRMHGDSSGGQPIVLPSRNVSLSFNFDIVQGDNADAIGDLALFTPAADGQPASLTWTVPIGFDQLQGVLPDGGNVAIWIEKAEFFVAGGTPNQKSNFITKVATSGTYQNGFGRNRAYTFVTKAMSGNYAYNATSGKVYNSWDIDVSVFMTPSTYTQWTMTFDPDGGEAQGATKLRMELTVAYRNPT